MNFRFLILDFRFANRAEGKEHRAKDLIPVLLALCFSAVLILSSVDAAADSMKDEGGSFILHTLSYGERMFRSGNLTEARKAFEKILELDSKDAQAHYFLGLIDYEEGSIEKAKTRFQIAHECVAIAPGPATVDDKKAQLDFSEEYEARVYYKDGWYVRPKAIQASARSPHSLEAGSTYRIAITPASAGALARQCLIGLIVVSAFLLAR